LTLPTRAIRRAWWRSNAVAQRVLRDRDTRRAPHRANLAAISLRAPSGSNGAPAPSSCTLVSNAPVRTRLPTSGF